MKIVIASWSEQNAAITMLQPRMDVLIKTMLKNGKILYRIIAIWITPIA